MNSRKTFFLIMLVGIVGTLVVLDHFKGTTTDDAAEKHKRLVDIDSKQVTHIELVRSNNVTLVLDKVGDHWEFRKPFTGRADFPAISEMLDQIEFAERSRTLMEKDLESVTLSDFGLDPPRSTIKLTAGNEVVTLHIGKVTPTKEAIYVQVEGHKRVHVVPKSIYDRASQGLDQLRDRTVIDFDPAMATRLEINRSVELGRSMTATNAEARWRLVRPFPARANEGKVNELIADLGQVRVLKFISDDPKDVHTYQLTEPEREITVYTGETGKTLQLGHSPTNDSNQVYAKLKGADAIFTVPAAFARKFAVPINDLRDAQIITTDPDQVQSVDIIHGTDKLEIRRDSQGWKLSTGERSDDRMMGQFFEGLEGLKVKQFTADVVTDLDPFGLATPAATVTLRSAGTNVLSELLIGSINTSNGVRFVKRSDEPFIYAVATNEMDRLPLSGAELRSHIIFVWKPEQITQISAGEVTVSRPLQGKWGLVAPAQGVLNIEALNGVIGTLAHLEAGSFGRPKTEADATRGFVIKATVGETNHWLAVSGDGVAATDSLESTFTLQVPVVDVLTQKLVTTLPVDISPAPAPSPLPAKP